MLSNDSKKIVKFISDYKKINDHYETEINPVR